MAFPEKQKPSPGEREGLFVGVLLDGEPLEYSPSPPRTARLILRSFFNDNGHFQGLEVLS